MICWRDMPLVVQPSFRNAWEPVVASVFAALFAADAMYSAETPKLVEILASELERNFQTLKEKGDPKPYFAAYAVPDKQVRASETASGLLAAQDHRHHRHRSVQQDAG